MAPTKKQPRMTAYVEQASVPMRDDVSLATDVYRPPHQRVPTVLLRTPYDRQLLVERINEIDPLMATRRGFAVVLQDVRGRYGSDGAFEPLMSDAADGTDSIAWIRRQPWSDGCVMMVGASYDGCVQFAAARARPDGLLAIAPTVTGALRQISHPGEAFNLSAIDGWVAMAIADAISREPDATARLELEDLLRATPLERFHALIDPETRVWRIGAPLRVWVSTSPSDRYWTETTAVPKRPLPAIHTTGYYDLCLDPAIEAYAAWSASSDQATPQLLTLGPWNHDLAAVYPELGLSAPLSPPGLFALERQLSFFDAVLGRAPAEDLAPVKSFVLGRNRWHEDTRWPPAGVRQMKLWLTTDSDGNRRLAGENRRGRHLLRYSYDPRSPVPTLGGGHAVWGLTGPMEQTLIEARPDVLSFTSARYEDEVEFAGAPMARLLVASSAPATDFLARLTLVMPDDRSLALVHGIWSGRLADLPVSPAHPDHRCCDVRLPPIHLALNPGMRLRLQITSSCYPAIYPNPNTGHDLRLGPPQSVQTAEQTLLLGGTHGSSLSLPCRGPHPREHSV